MAIRPDVIISAGKIDTSDNAYPYGKAQNRSAPGAGDGTNLEADWVNDLWGFLQAILSRIGVTPSGSPDEVGDSQYLDALEEIADRVNEHRGVLNWGKDAADLPASAQCNGGCWARSARLWIVVGGNDGCSSSFDDGRTWSDFSAGMGSTVNLLSVAASADGYGFAVGDSATYYRSSDLGTGGSIGSNWANLTMPGSPTALNTIKCWDFQNTHIVVGEKAGPEPYIANSADTTGTFTSRTVPASFSGKALQALAVGKTVAVAAAATAHTKIAFSDDGGDTWADSTTSLSSGIYQLTYNRTREKFYAIRTNSTSNNYVYESDDGDTWTLIYSGPLGFTGDVGGSAYHGLESYGAALVMMGTQGALAGVAVSTDGGASWKRQLFEVTGGTMGLVSDMTGSMMLAVVNGTRMYYAQRRSLPSPSALY